MTRESDDNVDSTTSIHSNPWLLFPWQSHAATSLVTTDDSSVTTLLTQFPPYGSTQQKSTHPDVPPDWLNHLSQLSALSTLSEQQQQQGQQDDDVTTSRSLRVVVPESLGYDWDASEQELWRTSMPSPPDETNGQEQDAKTMIPTATTTTSPATNTLDDELLLLDPRHHRDTTTWRERRRQRLPVRLVCDVCQRPCSTQPCVACRWSRHVKTTGSNHDGDNETRHVSHLADADKGSSAVTDPVPQNMESMDAAVANNTNEADPRTIDTVAATTTIPHEQISTPLPTRQDGNIHLGATAAEHLQNVARHLLPLHAPLLWNNHDNTFPLDRHHAAWINTLLTLATKTVSCVSPNVKQNGDLLDICPHVKIKTIAGGNSMGADCAYFSGVLFRKTISHKIMRSQISHPRILLLQGGIEFYPSMLQSLSTSGSAIGAVGNRPAAAGRHAIHRTGSSSTQASASPLSARRGTAAASPTPGASVASYTAMSPDLPVVLSSLDTLMEHEDKYLDRLVSQLLLVFRPDVIIAGGSVCRRAQEKLSQSMVTVVSHVKPKLLQRIARQTKARVLTAEGIKSVLLNQEDEIENAALEDLMVGRCHRFRLVTFRDNELWGDNISPTSDENASLDIRSRPLRSIDALLADPNVLHGDRQAALVARQLGQGVLDGSEALKAGLAKRGVAQTFVMLEGTPKELGCTVVLRGSNKMALKQLKVVFRFLVNVAYNLRLETSYLRERGARIRPDFQESENNAFSSSLCVDYGEPPAGKKVRPWNGSNAERIPRTDTGEVTAFDQQAILITSVWMTQQSQCCPAEVKGICYYSMQDVALGQFLRDSCFNLSLKCQNPNCKKSVLDHSLSFVHNDGLVNISVEELDEELPPSPRGDPTAVASADKRIATLTDIDQPICTWSFCKNCNKVVSPVRFISDDTWKFSFGKFLETFFYNRDAIVNAPDQQCSCGIQTATRLYFGCGKLAAQFTFEAICPFGVFVRRTLPMQTGFQREEGLRRLDLISKASSKLFVKFDKQIEKISRETRSLFNAAAVRPEHLQTVLSELNKMSTYVDDAAKTLQDKIASVSDSLRRHGSGELINSALFRFPWFARRYLFMLTYAWNEKLSAAGQAITTMKKFAAAASNRDGGIGSNVAMNISDPSNDELMESMKQLRKLNEHYTRYNMADITQVLPPLSESNTELQQDGDYEDDFDKEESSAIDFADGVDADVLASRRRLQTKGVTAPERTSSRPRPVKSLGTRRSDSAVDDPTTAVAKPTPGGAVKSALNRFFNRGGRDQDPYTVDLGVFSDGRPRLAPGVNGIVVPVFDEQLSTIIAYSLSSTEYAKQFKYYSRHENSNDMDAPTNAETGSGKPVVDAETGPNQKQGTGDEPASGGQASQQLPVASSTPRATTQSDPKSAESRMLVRSKSHVKHTFRDFDEKGQATCKFVCTTYWATQFHAVRQIFLSQSKAQNPVDSIADDDAEEFEQSYIESLSSAYAWAASGGKSGASFHRTSDDRFVIKFISRTELQMFLDCAPAYFEYLSKAFFHGLPTVLCKIVGVYQIGVHNRITGKRTMEQVAVMQNIFYNRKISRVFDLKGSLRGRFAAQMQNNKDESQPDTPSAAGSDTYANNAKKLISVDETTSETGQGKESPVDDEANQEEKGLPTLLDGDFLEWTRGRPMPLTDRAKAVFQMSILNDTLFLSIINVLDYSILVGIDDENQELVVGIIDFMRQYDIMKQMERVGKSLPMVVGSEAPTIIQPPLYKARFSNAMERYFMGIPNKWTTI